MSILPRPYRKVAGDVLVRYACNDAPVMEVDDAAVVPYLTEDAMWLLDAPVKTFSQSIVDDTIRTNAEFQSKAGLRPRIIRRDSGGCCDWCAKLAGTYDYPGVPREVYRRHANCNCTVEYDPGSGKRVQDVWTKKWTRKEESGKIEERKQIGQNQVYENAKNGGKHKGVYIDATKKKKSSLRKSIDSHLEQVEIHKDKLAHPEKYDVGWRKKDDRSKMGLLKKWQKDLQRNQEQAVIEQEVWKERFEKNDK